MRPPWNGVGEHTRFPIARLRYTSTRGIWELYYRDRNLKFHLYKYTKPTAYVQQLLEYIRNSGDPIFFC